MWLFYNTAVVSQRSIFVLWIFSSCLTRAFMPAGLAKHISSRYLLQALGNQSRSVINLDHVVFYKCCKLPNRLLFRKQITEAFFFFAYKSESVPVLAITEKCDMIIRIWCMSQHHPGGAAHHGAARLEQPSVPLISSFIPWGHPLTDDDRTMTKVNWSLNQS